MLQKVFENLWCRLFLDKNFPSQRVWKGLNLCQYPQKGLGSKELVHLQYLGSGQMLADSSFPRKRFERRSRKNVHGELRGILQACKIDKWVARSSKGVEGFGKQHKYWENGGIEAWEGFERSNKERKWQQKEMDEKNLIFQ